MLRFQLYDGVSLDGSGQVVIYLYHEARTSLKTIPTPPITLLLAHRTYFYTGLTI